MVVIKGKKKQQKKKRYWIAMKAYNKTISKGFKFE